MHRLLSSLVTLSVLFAIGCKDDPENNTVVGSGPVVSETVIVDDFHSVRNVGTANVEFEKDNQQKVEFVAQQNIIDVMTADVEFNILTLSFEPNTSIQTDQDIMVNLKSDQLFAINNIGTGNFTATGVLQDLIDIELTGTGNVDIYNQAVDTANIILSGTGNVFVRANNQLNVTLTGTGNVFYKGNPTLDVSILGTGDVIDDN